MTVLAIDPGPTESAFVLWDGAHVSSSGKIPNYDMLTLCRIGIGPHGFCAIEKIASYGMAVGEEVFETVFWSGRFAEAFPAEHYVFRIPRLEVKMHLCHDSRAKDANIRQALIDRLGAPGTKKHPGPTYGISGDVWAALAVAVRFWDAREFYLQTKGAA